MTTWQENDLHAAQLELEKESTSLGIARYEKIREQRQEAETGPGRKLVMESIDATAAAIMAFVAEADTGKPGKRHAALKFIRHLNPHALAYASDARLKKNIVDASASKVGDFFDRFRVREFDWDAEAIAELNPTLHPSAEHEVGGIAQEAEEVYSLMVATHANGIKTIQWEKAVPFLIAEVQALRKRVADLGGGA